MSQPLPHALPEYKLGCMGLGPLPGARGCAPPLSPFPPRRRRRHFLLLQAARGCKFVLLFTQFFDFFVIRPKQFQFFATSYVYTNRNVK